jgi:(2S)-methylsuccinyl-CoA dehydrogenase
MSQTAIIPDLLALTEAALPQVESLLVTSQAKVKAKVSEAGRVSAAKLEEHQFAAHALSWLATYVEALRQLRAWAGRLDEQGRFGPMEALIVQIGFGEYLAQIAGGIPMSQGEMARLSDLELSWQPQDAAATLIAQGNSPAARSELVSLMRDNHPGSLRRLRVVESLDGRRVGGIVARLHRSGVTWDAQRDCGGTDLVRRNARAEGAMVAETGQR